MDKRPPSSQSRPATGVSAAHRGTDFPKQPASSAHPQPRDSESDDLIDPGEDNTPQYKKEASPQFDSPEPFLNSQQLTKPELISPVMPMPRGMVGSQPMPNSNILHQRDASLTIREGQGSQPLGSLALGNRPSVPGGDSDLHISNVLHGDAMRRRESRVKRNNTQVMLAHDEDELPNYIKMKETLGKLHAKRDDGKDYGCCEAWCDVDPGCHFCGWSTEAADLDKYGIGVMLYFKFLKYLIGWYVIFLLFAAPSIYFSCTASSQFQSSSRTYSTYLYYTSIGSIGRGGSPCSLGSALYPNQIQLQCSQGYLSGFDSLEWGLVLQSNTACADFTFYSWLPQQCQNASSGFQQSYTQNCSKQKSCNLNINPSLFDFTQPNCGPYNNGAQQVYFRATCDGIDILMPNGDKATKSTVAYIIASSDAILCFLFFIMLIYLKKSEEKSVKNALRTLDMASKYTVEVGNLPLHKTEEEMAFMLWSYFTQGFKSKVRYTDFSRVKVIDVQLILPQTKLVCRNKLARLDKREQDRIKSFIKDWDSNQKIGDNVDLKVLRDLAVGTRNKNATDDFNKIAKIHKEKKQWQIKQEEDNKNPDKRIVGAFITFETLESRDLIIKHFRGTPVQKCCASENDIRILDKKFLKIKPAPEPDNILWEHMDVTTRGMILRRGLSFLLTVILWIITFGFLIYVKNLQQDYFNQAMTIDCGQYPSISQSDVVTDYQNNNAKGYLGCYCSNDIFGNLETKFNVNGSEEKLCLTWYKDQIVLEGLPLIAVFVIIVVNFILPFLFKALSTFEKHRYTATEMAARILKVFISQFLNTGVLILVVNAQVSNRPITIFSGKYDDLDVEWYSGVGATILTTMILNIATIPLSCLIMVMFKGMRRCCDRRGGCDESKTHTDTQNEYVSLYTGLTFDLDVRYAQIIMVIFVNFLYGAALPLLFVSTIVTLIVIYWVDKLLFLKFFRLPKNFDEKLQETVRNTLIFILLIHLAFAVWTYGAPNIFGRLNQLNSDYKGLVSTAVGASYYAEQIGARIFLGHNIALDILFLVILAYIIFNLFLLELLLRFFQLCFRCCKKTQYVGDSSQAKLTFFQLLTDEELDDEIRFCQHRIRHTEHPGLKSLLQERFDSLWQEHTRRDRIPNYREDRCFISLPSYDVLLNPQYKKFTLNEIQQEEQHAPGNQA
jgi:hypothetical protein